MSQHLKSYSEFVFDFDHDLTYTMRRLRRPDMPLQSEQIMAMRYVFPVPGFVWFPTRFGRSIIHGEIHVRFLVGKPLPHYSKHYMMLINQQVILGALLHLYVDTRSSWMR